MNINIDTEKIKKAMQSKATLISVIAACSVGILLIIILLSRYVFDCVSVEKSINVRNENEIGYEVFYDNAGTELPGKMGMNQNYLSKFTNRVEVTNYCKVFLSAARTVKPEYKVSTTFVVRARSAGNPVVMSVKGKDDGNIKTEIGPTKDGNIDYLYACPEETIVINLAAYKERFDNFVTEYQEKSGESLQSISNKFTAEVVVEFSFRVIDVAGIVNSKTVRGVVIPVTSDVYTINTTGQPILESKFPGRNPKLPKLATLITVTLLLVLLITLLVVSARTLCLGKDLFKRAYKSIIRKYGADIVITADGTRLPLDNKAVDVKEVIELVKFSHITNKPIICYRLQSSAVFCIDYDDVSYRFIVNKGEYKTKQGKKREKIWPKG